MEMPLAAEDLALVSGKRRASGEYILVNSEVNRFLFIVMLFLCVGGILIGVLYYMFTELLCYVHVDPTVSRVTALQVSALATSWTRGSRSLAPNLCMEPWWCNSFWRRSSRCVWSRERAVGDEVDRDVSQLSMQHRCSVTGGRRQVNQLMELRSMVKRPRVLFDLVSLAAATRLNTLQRVRRWCFVVGEWDVHL